MNTLLLLSTKKGLAVLGQAVADCDPKTLKLSTIQEIGVIESFYYPIINLANKAGVEWFPWSRESIEEKVEKYDIGTILCVGWKYLLPPIKKANCRVVVAHDSLLPKLRGFAPLPTAIIAGHAVAGVTFFESGKGTDDGPILWQSTIDIGPKDTVGDLINSLLPLYRLGANCLFTDALYRKSWQDELQATYSIWRNDDDYWIDWNQPATVIERTIRALGPPYLGARTALKAVALPNRIQDEPIVVTAAEVVPDLAFEIRQPGKIWNLDDQGRPTVVCGSGMLKITGATMNGRSVLPLHSLRQRFIGAS